MPVYRVQNISWAAEGAGVLPCEATVECAGVNDIADTLSDHYGWLSLDLKWKNLCREIFTWHKMARSCLRVAVE